MERVSSWSSTRSPLEGEQVLEAVGITPDEELLFRVLLPRKGASAAELAELSGRSRRAVEVALRRLRDKGLASQLLGQQGRYVAAHPSQALEILFLQKEEELRRARLEAQRLIEEAKRLRPPEAPAELVEVVTGRDAITQRWIQLQRSAEHEVLTFDTPPYVSTTSESPRNEVEIELLQKGIRYRAIYDRSALEFPGQIEQIAEITREGEQARIVDRLPMRLAIADHKLGLIPLSLASPIAEEGDILIHPSPLLEALIMLFEALWRVGAPIRVSGTGVVEVDASPDNEISPEDQKLLLLLAADLKEEVIGLQLGISRRTVQRRSRDLTDRFGVQTRLQLVLEAARRGLV